MYAVFRSGGKQYRASQGERLRVEKLDADEGSNVSFDEVLLVGEGTDVQVGRPLLDGTAVTAKVLQQGKSRKVPVVKFRRRQNYLRQGSHRQFFTEVEILAIGAAGDAPKSEGAADKPAAKKAATKKPATKKPAAKKAAKKASKKKASE
jgi:large subunit ribosomal protein L21